MTGIFVEPHSQIPAHAQIEDQIKFACVRQTLKPGDALPSIRRLARQLTVGDGVVRRAYRELREAGLLATDGRNHVVDPRALAPASKTELVQASAEQCHRLIRWARERRVSTVALSRLLLRHAAAQEFTSPSYLFVDICSLAAERSAAKASRAWGIRIAGVSIGGFTRLWNTNARDVSAVLVNEHLYKDLIEGAGQIVPPAFPIRSRPDERLRRLIRRLPARSAVLLVCSDEEFSRTGRAILRLYEDLADRGRRFQVKKTGDIPDLTHFILTHGSRLLLFSPAVWETLPARIKRMATVAPAFSDPDPQSLEETRIAAGVLL